MTFSDEEFIRHVTHRAGATLESVEVVGDVEAQFAVTTVRTMAADRLPEMARKFVGSSVQLTQVDTYSTADAEGIRVVRTEISVGALPVSGSATQTLTPMLVRRTDLAVANPYANPRPVTRAGIESLLRDAWTGAAPGAYPDPQVAT